MVVCESEGGESDGGHSIFWRAFSQLFLCSSPVGRNNRKGIRAATVTTGVGYLGLIVVGYKDDGIVSRPNGERGMRGVARLWLFR